MYKTKTLRPLVQSLGIIGAILVLVSGVTFAALQSQRVVMQGNSIQTAMADLKISRDGATYSNTVSGYGYGNMIPGGGAYPQGGNPVYLLNNGTSTLALKLSVANDLTNADNVNLSKVHVTLTPIGGGAPQSISLAELVAADATGGVPITVGSGSSLSAKANAYYAMRIVMDVDSVSGSSALIGNISFNFNATAVS